MNVYVDTGGWVAYFDQSDRFHPLVTPYMQATLLQAVDRLVTSDYVLDETVTVDKDFVIFGLVILPEELARLVLSSSQP